MSDALQKVKRDLGRDAVILNTRTVNRGGLWRLSGRQMVEITAAKEINVLHPSARRGNIPADLDGRGLKAEGVALAQPPDVAGRDDAVDRLRREVGTVRSLVQDLLSESRQAHLSSVPQDLHQTYLHLIQQEVAAEITSQLLQQLRRELNPQQLADRAIVNARLGAYIEAMVPAGGPVICDRSDRAKVVVLVGPTGVGKTTTIAKLAASFRLREHRSVALVTIDTYRIGAVDQLRTYAQILDVPLKVVLTPDEFRDVLAGLRSHDLIFVDTAGRSQNDTIKLNELRRFFESAKPDEVHLVLAGNCSHKVMLSAVRQFGSLGIDRVIFTKLDESVGFGVVLSVIKQVDAKLSYLTTGQNVPDDIEVGSGRRLAQLILGSPDLAGALGK